MRNDEKQFLEAILGSDFWKWLWETMRNGEYEWFLERVGTKLKIKNITLAISGNELISGSDYLRDFRKQEFERKLKLKREFTEAITFTEEK